MILLDMAARPALTVCRRSSQNEGGKVMLAILAALVVSQASGNSFVWVDAKGTVVTPLIGDFTFGYEYIDTTPEHFGELRRVPGRGKYAELARELIWSFDPETAQIVDNIPLITPSLIRYPLPWCNGTPSVMFDVASLTSLI